MTLILDYSDKQLECLKRFKNNENIVILGSAGTGKSKIIKDIYKLAKDNYKNIVLTATTGIAAYNISGMTIHSFMGFGTGSGLLENVINKIRKNKDALNRILALDILVIDEISMMSAKFFERLNTIFKTLKRNSKFFGGVQLILSGDLLQLTPVFDKNTKDIRMIHQSSIFKNLTIVHLDKIFRQSDQLFVDLLARLRIGEHTESDIDMISSRLVDCKLEDELNTIHLVPTNKQMQSINITQLEKLTSKKYHFTAHFFGDRELVSELQTQFNQRGLTELTLKVGAKVMLVKNLNVNEGLVNGSLGIITEFKNGIPLVQFTNKNIKLIEVCDFTLELGKKLAVAKQIPLVLAWSTTIHKSQSQTLESAILTLDNCFTEHQIYVALSRVRSLSNVYLKTFDSTKIYVNKNVKEFLKPIE